jgi:hypothetical protein
MSETEDSKVRFNKEINLGNVLTIVSMLMVLVAQWSFIDKRVVVLEEYKKYQEMAVNQQRDRDLQQDTSTKDKFNEVKDVLSELRRSVEKVADRVGVK